MSEYKVSIDEDNRDRNLVFKKVYEGALEYGRDGESNVFYIDEI
jgi:hypothetical protein